PSELSGGEQARAAMAQVLAGGPGIVVADEPTAELDTLSTSSVLLAIRRLVDLGVTFVLATHDPAVIRASHDVVELEHGRLRRKTRVRRDEGVVGLGSPARPTSLAEPAPPPDRPHSVTVEAASVTKTYRRGPEE